MIRQKKPVHRIEMTGEKRKMTIHDIFMTTMSCIYKWLSSFKLMDPKH